MSYGPEVERNIARAHKLRARFFASLLRQSWAGIKRIARRGSPRPSLAYRALAP